MAKRNDDLANRISGLRVMGRFMMKSPKGEDLKLLKDAIEELAPSDRLLCDANERLSGDTQEQEELNLLVDWTKLFRGLSPTAGPRPPYEFVYRGKGEDIGAILSLKEEYARLGFEVSKEVHDRPDFLPLEIECVAALMEQGRFGEAHAFCAQHLTWVENFCDEALPYAKTPFYQWYLRFLAQSVEELLR